MQEIIDVVEKLYHYIPILKDNKTYQSFKNETPAYFTKYFDVKWAGFISNIYHSRIQFLHC
ncbi:MAG: hypothetical protein ABJ092_12945 [Gillisia sp.]